MANLVKKDNIELWDCERVDHNVVYHYVTSLMNEDHPCINFRVDADDLENFVIENELNQHQTDVDDFKSYDAWDYLMDCWSEVKDQYWEEYLHPKLECSFSEAMAYVQSYIDKASKPLTPEQMENLYNKAKANYGINVRASQ